MSTTAALIYAILILAAFFFALWASFALRDILSEIICDDTTDDGWKIILYLPFLVVWLWCFILEVAGTILAIVLIIDAANGLKKWWHNQ
jgi:hypothetical protein